MSPALESRLRALETFIQEANADNLPESTRGHLYRFGAVLICGNMERCVEIVVLDHLSRRAHARVISFVKSHFLRGYNIDCAAIGQLLNRFDSEWYKKLNKFVEDNPYIKEGISSCYSVRNSVAHGGTMSVGSKRLNELFDVSKKLIEGLIEATE